MTVSIHVEQIPTREDPILSICQKSFGLSYPFPWQRLIIAAVLDAVSSQRSMEDSSDREPLREIAVLPTGAGKSLCWMLPASVIDGITVAVFPLLSLMADQKRRLDAAGLSSVTLKGGLTGEKREEIWRALDSGKTRIILANPEILSTAHVAQRLKEMKPEFLVVDETHTVSQWGESFRPACAGMGVLVEDWNPAAVLALTATAGPLIRSRITELLFNGHAPTTALANPNRPELYYGVIPALSRYHILERLVRNEPRPLIVFGPTRLSVVKAARLLRDRLKDKRIRYYHAGLSQEEKTGLETWFLGSGDAILCATCAYGMGVDKSDIRTVIHLAPPDSAESYLQESGRASRDGKGANAWLIWTPDDLRGRSMHASSAHSEHLQSPAEKLSHERRQSIINYAISTNRCRRELLLETLGIEASDCSGCDVCGAEPWTSAPEEKPICRTIMWNQRRLSRGQAARVLIGRRSAEIRSKGLDTLRGFGSLSAWELEDAECAIETLLGNRKLRLGRFGPWKNLLSVNHSRTSPKKTHSNAVGEQLAAEEAT